MNLAEWMLANLSPEVIEDSTDRKIAELINSRLQLAFDEGYDLGNFDGQCTTWTPFGDRPYRAPEPYPCGHQPSQRGCGGCDPSAVDYEFGGEE